MWKVIRALTIYGLLILTEDQLASTSASTLTCPGTLKPCGNKYCYDPTTHICSDAGTNVTCIATCGWECYNDKTHICINNKICTIGQNLCEIRYDPYFGKPIEPPQLQCYNSLSQRCLNHTICHDKDRVCNGQCILYGTWASWPQSLYEGEYKVCASDNVTLCTVPQKYTSYKPNQIKACNGTCFDYELGLQHCVNGSLQCISTCNNRCYNATTHVCLNDTICNQDEEVCLIDYDSYYRPISPPIITCYSPLFQKCLNHKLCSRDRICNGQCIVAPNSNYLVCANDRRTLCNITQHYGNIRPYQMHLCNDHCYDTTIRQCVNAVISCIDGTCGNLCYNSEYKICINGSVCSIGHGICEIKYNIYSGQFISPSQLECYDLKSQVCLNHTICKNDRACGGHCITGYDNDYKVCANGTICRTNNLYTNYKPNQIQLCNGTCFDAGNPLLKHCVNGSVDCISKCSSSCYYSATHVCINETLCNINEKLCHINNRPGCYNPSYYNCLNNTLCRIGYHLCYPGSCYNPASQKCLGGIICDNNRICGGKCIIDNYQVCASDQKTICNVTKPYNSYQPNQIQICLGVCYDSAVQQCTGDPSIICIEDPGNILCLALNINSSTTTTSSMLLSTTNGSSFATPTVSSMTSIGINITNSSILTNNSTLRTSTLVSINSTALTTTSSSSILSSFTSLWTTLKSTLSESILSTTTSSTSTSAMSSTSTSTTSSISTSTTSATSTRIASSTSTSTTSSTSTSTTSSTSTSTTSTSTISRPLTSSIPSLSDSCCAVQQCNKDADCCIRGTECQCYRHNQTHEYGACLNSSIKPICSDGCPQAGCFSDVDCCKCQCGTITMTNVDGQIITRKQCVSRQ
ncbi:unnamed protein product [Rotaria magnacalcarata]|uniref:Uncharacterized protein n=2 Tax=Rotaria magnacalcarata TaxID=392030 RepID=A0A816CB45_9BILA|nr:unnamed protein product [Rotaria magnacalcarata]CAF4168564.1 unnamed protein product [Rotaria magnacalcarata]